MNVLVIGKGGREHALAWKIAKSELVERVFVAPGNPGTARDDGTENIDLGGKSTAEIAAWALDAGVELVVVGPEAPLVEGVADTLRGRGLLVVGPGADGAELEGSKAFAKEIMEAAGVPTAQHGVVTSHEEVDAFCDAFDGEALVVKADGLAAGKGVVVCDTVDEARAEAHRFLDDRPFGDASATLVLEERLDGVEASYIVLVDGSTYVPLPTSQDHKRLLDNDEGPNTGGMGAYSPTPFLTEGLQDRIQDEVIQPTIDELRQRGIDFRGFLYAGLMLTGAGPKVLEFNVRLGDPEAQPLLAGMRGDLVPLLLGCAKGNLSGLDTGTTTAAACVVLAAEGYPFAPKKGSVIEGVDAADARADTKVFHAGTATRDGKLVVAGGRVLGVTAWADDPEAALRKAYAAVAEISWPGMQHRTDIGHSLQS